MSLVLSIQALPPPTLVITGAPYDAGLMSVWITVQSLGGAVALFLMVVCPKELGARAKNDNRVTEALKAKNLILKFKNFLKKLACVCKVFWKSNNVAHCRPSGGRSW